MKNTIMMMMIKEDHVEVKTIKSKDVDRIFNELSKVSSLKELNGVEDIETFESRDLYNMVGRKYKHMNLITNKKFNFNEGWLIMKNVTGKRIGVDAGSYTEGSKIKQTQIENGQTLKFKDGHFPRK